MAGRLQNKVAVVIGAGAIGPGWGNGKASAVLLAREGAKVMAVDISLDAAEETAAIIRSEGGTVAAHAADASRAPEVERLVASCVERWGRIDVLHHNIGIVRLGGPVELSLEEWNRVLEVNLTSAFLTFKYTLPVMERQGSGVLLTTGSVAGMRFTGVPYVSYSATKAAIAQLTQVVALQYASKGIRANCIAPGLMNTPFIREGLPRAYAGGDVDKMFEVRARQCPTGKMGDAWDVAHAAVFLASDEARYITGTTLVVDGGISCKYC